MRLFALCLAVVFVASCAPTRYPEDYQQQPASLHLGEGGKVKRGNPYQIDGQWYYPLATGENYDEVGVASWYGDKFHGLKTANGETYNMYAMTAAHTTLPMPSLVRVTNLENGKSVTVRVNDRGPFAKSRLIDLSYAAAKALGTVKHGTARVRVQTLQSADVSSEKVTKPTKQAAKPSSVQNLLVQAAPVQSQVPSVSSKVPYVQVGAFSSESNAIRMVEKLKKHEKYASAKVIPVGHVYRVRVGPFAQTKDAELVLNDIQSHGYTAAMVIHD